MCSTYRLILEAIKWEYLHLLEISLIYDLNSETANLEWEVRPYYGRKHFCDQNPFLVLFPGSFGVFCAIACGTSRQLLCCILANMRCIGKVSEYRGFSYEFSDDH